MEAAVHPAAQVYSLQSRCTWTSTNQSLFLLESLTQLLLHALSVTALDFKLLETKTIFLIHNFNCITQARPRRRSGKTWLEESSSALGPTAIMWVPTSSGPDGLCRAPPFGISGTLTDSNFYNVWHIQNTPQMIAITTMVKVMKTVWKNKSITIVRVNQQWEGKFTGLRLNDLSWNFLKWILPSIPGIVLGLPGMTTTTKALH